MNDGSSCPEDLAACHRLIRELSSRLEAQDAQLHQQSHELESRAAFAQEQSRTVVDLEASHHKLFQENEELKLTIRKLIERLYGRRSERFLADPNQISLDFGDDAAAAAEALAEAVLEAERVIEEVQNRRRAKRHKPRLRSEKFPEHLPRYEKIVDLPEEQKAGKTFIGYDEVETLEFERARLRVRVTKYAKYADRRQPHQGVESPERPTGLVEGNRFDTSVAVEIIAERFFYHLPYYRQQDVFAGCGWTPSRSTLLNIVTASEFVLEPLVQYYHDLLGKIDVLGCDETPLILIVPPQLPASIRRIRAAVGCWRCFPRPRRKGARASRGGCGLVGRSNCRSTFSTLPSAAIAMARIGCCLASGVFCWEIAGADFKRSSCGAMRGSSVPPVGRMRVASCMSAV